MTTIDRIESASPTAWSPRAAGFPTTDEDDYVGRHRKPGLRGFAALRVFYSGRHRLAAG